MTQSIIVFCIVFLAIGYVVYSFARTIMSKQSSGCSGCSGCKLKNSQGKSCNELKL